jgi:predicted GNAT family acetyltransferase
MAHILDNMIWNAITTGNRNIATVNGNVGCYQEHIAPFAGLQELNEANLSALHDFLPAGRRVAVSSLENISPHTNKWELVQVMDCCQMVYTKPVTVFTTPATALIVPLTEGHVPQMLELTALTKPGPFFRKTILFGNYFGIFADGRLAAMTGQRMHPLPYLEVSAVCTHPDFRGKGYAKTLMLHVMKLILDNSFTPFLHVLSSNTGAIQLYESIGFSTRTRLYINVLKKL